MIELLNAIHWREPLWLLLSLQPIVLLILSRVTKKLRNDKFAEPHLLPWVMIDNKNTNTRNRSKSSLLHISWLVFAIAMAGPRIVEKIVSSDTSSYTSIMVLFDVSRSMSARDIHPSRLERSKLELYDLIERSQQARIGIIVYASKPHLLSPLTSDKNVLRHYISSINTPLLPTRGSDLKSALLFSARTLADNTTKPKAILLISDGENTHKTIEPFNETLSLIKNRNISVYSLITGTESGTPLLADESGWLTHNDEDVISRSQTALLQDIALLTNGSYSNIKDNNEDWQQLYDEGIAKLSSITTTNKKDTNLVIWYELYPWCLIIALLFFILAYWNPGFKKISKHITIIPIFILGLYMLPSQSQANDLYQQAYLAYQQQQYPEAAELFSQISGYAARIGEASATYHDKNYKKSIAIFIQATLEAQTDSQRTHALFNLANSYYQLAQYVQAAKIYQDVLRYQPDMEQAKVNLGYAIALSKKQQNDELSSTNRGGKGPGTARIEPGADISKGNLTLGTDSDEEPVGLFYYPDTTSKVNNDAALSSAGLVTQDIDKSKDTQWTYQIKSPDEISSILNGIEVNEPVFWQRLFEWEEGFPAPLYEPQTISGVKPW